MSIDALLNPSGGKHGSAAFRSTTIALHLGTRTSDSVLSLQWDQKQRCWLTEQVLNIPPTGMDAIFSWITYPHASSGIDNYELRPSNPAN
jgi:hypothetical protein